MIRWGTHRIKLGGGEVLTHGETILNFVWVAAHTILIKTAFWVGLWNSLCANPEKHLVPGTWYSRANKMVKNQYTETRYTN